MQIQRQQSFQSFGMIRIPGVANRHVSGIVSHFCRKNKVDNFVWTTRGKKRVQYVKTRFSSMQEKALLARIRKFNTKATSTTTTKMEIEVNKRKGPVSVVKILREMFLPH